MRKIVNFFPLVLLLMALVSCNGEYKETKNTEYETKDFKTSEKQTTARSSENETTTSKDNIETTTSRGSEDLITTTTVNTKTDVKIITTDPYKNTSVSSFYNKTYKPADSYEDAQYRTKHGLISGSIDEKQMTSVCNVSKYNMYYVSDAYYTYRSDGTYESYKINYTSNQSSVIYYGGGYVTLDEVCAYIKAFGEVPPNNNYATSDSKRSISKWGKYGRVNNTGHKNLEGLLPKTSDKGTQYKYIETDFGATDINYNNGKTIKRGTCRIVFTSNVKNIDERRVFYTNTHYKSYQEYLNFYGGFSMTFNTMNGAPQTKDISLVELKRLMGLF